MIGILNPLFRYRYVSWHECISVLFLEKVWSTFCVATCMVSFFIKLADVKHESLEAYLVKFKENLSFGFKTMAIFSKVMFLKIEYSSTVMLFVHRTPLALFSFNCLFSACLRLSWWAHVSICSFTFFSHNFEVSPVGN